MNNFHKFRYWSSTRKGSILLSILVSWTLAIVIFVPIIVTSDGANGNITAYNRDGNSGTRESFDELILQKEEYEQFSSNVVEVDGSATMETRVENDNNGIGYVSASQVIDYENSPSNGSPEDIRYFNENLIVLSFEGVFPTQDNILSGVYEAAKQFNMFFRVDKCEESQWGFYEDPTNNPIDPTSYWVFPDPTYSGCGYSDGRNEEDNLSFIIGFAFYNYLLYSEEITDILPLSSSSETVDFSDEAIPNLVSKLNESGYNTSNEITLYSIGSTSVVQSLNKAFNAGGEIEDPIYQSTFQAITNAEGLNIQYVKSHEGSSDAFNNPDSDSVPVSLGFQSRSARLEEGENEFENWGYNVIEPIDPNDDIDYDGAYYSGWEFDALAMIVNEANPIYSDNGQNITREQVRLIYLYGESIRWEDIYLPTT